MTFSAQASRLTLAIGVAAVVVSGGGIATAAYSAGTSSDAIEGCVHKTTGVLRVANGTPCKSSETALSWNKQGLPGVDGKDAVLSDQSCPAGGFVTGISAGLLVCTTPDPTSAPGNGGQGSPPSSGSSWAVEGDISRACPAGAEYSETIVDITGDPNEAAIRCVVARGMLTPFPGGEFMPLRNHTRAQAATLVARALATVATLPEHGPDAFTDDDGSVHELFIDRLAAIGVIQEPTRTFRPNETVHTAVVTQWLDRAYAYATQTPVGSSPVLHGDLAITRSVLAGHIALTLDRFAAAGLPREPGAVENAETVEDTETSAKAEPIQDAGRVEAP